MDDMISRAAVVDAIEGVDWYHINKNGEMVHGANDAEHQAWYKTDDIYAAIERVPSAQPGQRNARVFQGIIVEYPSISAYPEYDGKPYFSIKYTENGQEFIGYGTYKPEVLSEYLKEYFMPPTQPGWIPTSVRLPEDNEEVLFCDNEGERWLGWHYGFWKTERLDFNEDDVVAWMPLPIPYREGEPNE